MGQTEAPSNGTMPTNIGIPNSVICCCTLFDRSNKQIQPPTGLSSKILRSVRAYYGRVPRWSDEGEMTGGESLFSRRGGVAIG
jgi:hypothetical protein